jgi:uncharacterized surface anchored protein
MRRVLNVLLAATVVTAGIPAAQASPAKVQAKTQQVQAASGQITGHASDVKRRPLSRTTVRLRNSDTGKLLSATTTDQTGGYSFSGLGPGNYVVEIVNDAGNILGVSTPIALTTTSAIAGVNVTATVGALAGGGGFFGSTLGIVSLIGIAGAGTVATVIAVKNDASGSK